uniref:Uncharacterized protein n=1 Tax=Molossus molossus TaxID=27622 RepID=A0A7J8FZK0_MOLMO|nr:hypothetical protein HJG59_008282 [Molossus molossus]
MEGGWRAPNVLPHGQVNPPWGGGGGGTTLASATGNCVRQDSGGPPAAFRPPRRGLSARARGWASLGRLKLCRIPGRSPLIAAAWSQEHSLLSAPGKYQHLLCALVSLVCHRVQPNNLFLSLNVQASPELTSQALSLLTGTWK